jgi:hypothetical protein
MNRFANIALGSLALYAFIVVLMFVGWVMNLVKIAGVDFSHPTGLEIMRFFGIPMFPLGAVLGYF